MKIILPKSILAGFLFFTVFLLGSTAFGQTTGDYRSKATGNWTATSSWEYYNGSGWVPATSYPGQSATTGATGTVTIQGGFKITLNTNLPNSFTSLVIGGTGSGKLIVSGSYTVQTTSVTLKSNGIMEIGGNNTISFPANTSFGIDSGAVLQGSGSPCSNNTAIYIGSYKVSACNGSGGGALSNFSEFTARGGNGSATSNSPVCTGSPLTLTATPPVATSGGPYTYTYKWSGPGISTPTASTNPIYTISNAGSGAAGLYTVEIKDGSFTTKASTTVVINPTPVGGGVYSGNTPICLNSSTGNMTLGGGYVGNVVRWEKKLSSASSWTPISNTSSVYSENPSVDGTWQYRAVVGSGACPVVYSTPFSVVVNPALTISLVSNNASGCQNASNSTLSYTSITGNANLVYLDFSSSAVFGANMHQVVPVSAGPGTITIQYNWGAAPGTYNGVLTVVKDTQTPNCTSSTAYPITLTISSSTTPITISTHPTDKVICVGGNTSFSVVGSAGVLSYQWQVSTNGGVGYSNLSNGGVYSNVTTATMNITAATAGMANYMYRCIVNGCAGAVNSNGATLTFTPTVGTPSTPTPSATTICQGSSNTAYTTSATNATSYNWTVSGAGNTISGTGTTGTVTWAAGFTGSATISVTATGCGTSSAASTTVNVTPTVGTPSTPTPSASTICQGSPNTVYTTSASNAVSYNWSVTGMGNTISGTGTTGTVTWAPGFTGSATISVTATGCGTSSAASTTVTVNPTLSTATQPIFACDNSKATIRLTGLLPNVTSTVSYIIAGDAAPQTATVTADGSGIGYFDTRVLTVSPNDNNKILKITGIASGSTPSCTGSFNMDVPLKVQSNSGSIKLEGNAISGSTAFSELSTAHFSIDPIAGATGYTWIVPPTWNVTAGAGTNAITVTTGAYNDPDITVSVTALNSFCPTAVTVALSAIPPPAPVPSAIVAVSCNLLGSVTFNNLPAESWTLTTIKGSVSTVSTGSGNTSTVSNLTAGDYTFRITTARGSAVSGLVTVPDMPITTWTGGTTWSNGLPNDPAKKIILDAIGTPSGFMEGCSCTVKATANITIGSGQVLKLQNELNVETGGTLTFLNGASLVQKNDVTNSGIIHYNRTTSAVQDFDYVYWSSPVAGQTLGLLSPSSDKYWSFANDNWVPEGPNSIMTAGKGFIARVPRYSTSQQVDFIGVPNNGPVSIAAQGNLKGNLIGNPYPSAISADSFITDNASVINGALYFWTHNTARALNNTGTQYEYDSDDYASYNFTGGTATAAAAKSTDTNGDGIGDGVIPSGKIAAGQSFVVVSKNTDNFIFTNSMRIATAGNNGQFFKEAGGKKTEIQEKNRVWLNLTNDGGAFKQLLVGYITGATNGFDNLYDGKTLNGNAFIDFYSINNSENFVIQGRVLPFDPADIVPLGYKSTIAGVFDISIENADGNLTNQAIYLEDKVAKIIHNLKSGKYSFTTATGTFNDRFVLRYSDMALGTDDFNANGKGVVVSTKEHQVKINSFVQNIAAVKVYDIKGSLIYEKDKVDKKEWIINNLISNDQVLIIMTQLEDGKRVSDKIIFRD